LNQNRALGFVLTRFLHANRFPPVSASGYAGPLDHLAAEALAKAASLENALKLRQLQTSRQEFAFKSGLKRHAG
jgi:hypothetical protein